MTKAQPPQEMPAAAGLVFGEVCSAVLFHPALAGHVLHGQAQHGRARDDRRGKREVWRAILRHERTQRVHTYGAAIFTIVMFTTGGSLKASGLSVLYFIMIGFTNISGGPAWRSRSRSSAPTWPSRTWAPACCSASWAARSCSWSTAQWPAHQRRRIHARPSRLHAHHLHPRTGNDRSHHDPHPRCLQGRGQEDRQQALGQARR